MFDIPSDLKKSGVEMYIKDLQIRELHRRIEDQKKSLDVLLRMVEKRDKIIAERACNDSRKGFR